MILSDTKILEYMKNGEIIITPFDIKNLGGSSYDIHLSSHLAEYVDTVIDAKKHNEIRHFEIPEEGFLIEPGKLYLGSTHEYTEAHKHVPFIEGRSSTGRLGINLHANAGKGNVGFCGHWTLEISTSIPVRIYAGMPIGEILFFTTDGEVERVYTKKATANYSHQEDLPKESMMWKNF